MGTHRTTRHTQCQLSEGVRQPYYTRWQMPRVGVPRERGSVQGAKYSNIEAVKDAVKKWAVSLRREF